jgi:hypothetical protein
VTRVVEEHLLTWAAAAEEVFDRRLDGRLGGVDYNNDGVGIMKPAGGIAEDSAQGVDVVRRPSESR